MSVMCVSLLLGMLLVHPISSEEVFKYQVSKDVNGNPVCSVGPSDRAIPRIRSAIVCSGFCSLDSKCYDFNFNSDTGVCQLFSRSSTIKEVSIPNCKHYTKQRMEKLASTTDATTTASAITILQSRPATQVNSTSSSTSTQFNSVTPKTATTTFSELTTTTTIPSSTLKTTTIPAATPTSVMQTTKVTTTARTAVAQVTGPTGLPYPTSGLVQQSSSSILMQNNVNTPNAFNRSWLDFKNGFGDSNGNYWLGNDAIHNYLTGHPYQLYIYVYPVSAAYPYLAIYQWYFAVGDKTFNYQLDLSRGPGGNATSDGMGAMSGAMFSTFDNDNDVDLQNNCAATYGAGWWYGGNPLSNGYQCGTTMLNGCGDNFTWAQDTTLTLRASQMWMVY